MGAVVDEKQGLHHDVCKEVPADCEQVHTVIGRSEITGVDALGSPACVRLEYPRTAARSSRSKKVVPLPPCCGNAAIYAKPKPLDCSHT